MSTKIYDGFMFVPKDIVEINEKIIGFRKKVDKHIRKKFNEASAHIATNCIHQKCLGIKDSEEKEDKNVSPFFYAFSYLQKESREDEKSPYRGGIWDYSCSLTIHPHKGKFYGMLFSNDKDINKMFFKQSWIKEYGFWDNTDPMEGVSDKKWKQRGEDWDEMLKEFNYVPSMNGFVAELTQKMYCYISLRVEDILPFIDDFETRVDRLAEYQVYKEFEKLKKDNEKTIQGLLDFKEWIKAGNNGFDEWKKMKEFVASKIPKEITKDMLLGKNNC